MYTYKLLIYNLMESYIYIEFLKILLFYYFIDLCQILNWSKLGPAKFINLKRLLIYRILIYKYSTVCAYVRMCVIYAI